MKMGTLRRLGTAAIAAVAVAGATSAAPASADQNFGAGNLPGMEITEGGVLDYAASFPRCPDGYECMLAMRTTSGTAIQKHQMQQNGSIRVAADGDFDGTRVLKPYRPTDGPMVGVTRVTTYDDTVDERNEVLWVEARIDYYKGGCPGGIGNSASCRPESSFRWLGTVTILDNDSRSVTRYVKDGFIYRLTAGSTAKRISRARSIRRAASFAIPFDHATATTAAASDSAPPSEATAPSESASASANETQP